MNAFDHDLDGIAYRERALALCTLFSRNDALGLVSEIDKYPAFGDTDHLALDEIAGMIDGLLLLELFEDGTEIDLAALFLGDFFGRRCRRFCHASWLGPLYRWCRCCFGSSRCR